MAVCEVCGNDHDKAFEVVAAGQRHVFDSFECAVHAMAPVCEQCGCKVVGHGVETDGRFYCGAHCARAAGELARLTDRADMVARHGTSGLRVFPDVNEIPRAGLGLAHR